MSYKDKYGITDIRPEEDKVDCLCISWDWQDNPDDKSQRRPVFLYTPHMEDLDKSGCPHHYHIELNFEQAKKLRDWLSDYIEDVSE